MFNNYFSRSVSVAVATLTLLTAAAHGAETLPDVAARGVVREVQQLLDAGIPVDTRQPGTGWTPLIASVRAGKADVAKLLLDRGAKPDLAGATGYTPLMAATQTRNVSLIRLLLLRGANPNKATASGLTPLMLAAGNKPGTQTELTDLACVKLLLRAGADPDRAHMSGTTALSAAEAQKKPQVVAFLRRMSGGGLGGATVAASDGVIRGSVAYRERIAVPPAAFSVVRLVDVAPKSPVVLAQVVTPFAGKQVPMPFALAYRGASLAGRTNPTLAVDARIVSGGSLLFRMATPLSLPAPGTTKNTLLMLVRASADDSVTFAAEAIAATDKAILATGVTRSGSVRIGDITTSYTAAFLAGQLTRITANSTQGDYGNRTDRFYFTDGTDDRGIPTLRAAYLTAKRQARTLPSINGGETRVMPGIFEQVVQKIVLGDDGKAVSTAKTVDKQKQNVSPLDITAARNFARILAADALRRR